MNGRITLHSEHGVAPALLVCATCGKDSGVALLGSKADSVMRSLGQNGYKEGMNKVPDKELCSDCRSIINNKGIIFIGKDTKTSLLLNSDKVDEIIKSNLGNIIDFDKLRGHIVEMDIAFWEVVGDNITVRGEWVDDFNKKEREDSE